MKQKQKQSIIKKNQKAKNPNGTNNGNKKAKHNQTESNWSEPMKQQY